MQRILTSSGGICVPHDGFPSSLSADPSSFRLPETRIDDAFCRAGSRGISKEERPELFRTAHAIVSDRIAGGKLRGACKCEADLKQRSDHRADFINSSHIEQGGAVTIHRATSSS